MNLKENLIMSIVTPSNCDTGPDLGKEEYLKSLTPHNVIGQVREVNMPDMLHKNR